MGAGARLDPAAVAYADIADTYHCGLAERCGAGCVQWVFVAV